MRTERSKIFEAAFLSDLFFTYQSQETEKHNTSLVAAPTTWTRLRYQQYLKYRGWSVACCLSASAPLLYIWKFNHHEPLFFVFYLEPPRGGALGSGAISPHIFDFGSRWKWCSATHFRRFM